jgi:hypothetical protein
VLLTRIFHSENPRYESRLRRKLIPLAKGFGREVACKWPRPQNIEDAGFCCAFAIVISRTFSFLEINLDMAQEVACLTSVDAFSEKTAEKSKPKD